MKEKCNTCYSFYDSTIKLNNTRKVYPKSYKKRCAICKGYYVKLVS